MMIAEKKTKLNKYNSTVYLSLINKYPLLQLGFFQGDKILFVGQNPGMPSSRVDKINAERMLRCNSFTTFEKEYWLTIKTSLIGKIIGPAINNQWNEISMTNIVKIPTEQNAAPSDRMVKEFEPVLLKQCSLLKPSVIICFGHFAGHFFECDTFYKKIKTKAYDVVMTPHPSYFFRLNQTEKCIQKLKEITKEYI